MCQKNPTLAESFSFKCVASNMTDCGPALITPARRFSFNSCCFSLNSFGFVSPVALNCFVALIFTGVPFCDWEGS